MKVKMIVALVVPALGALGNGACSSSPGGGNGGAAAVGSASSSGGAGGTPVGTSSSGAMPTSTSASTAASSGTSSAVSSGSTASSASSASSGTPVNPCAQLDGGACGVCVNTNCCAEYTACAMDVACASSSCPEYGDCDPHNAAALALGQCMAASCGPKYNHEAPPSLLSNDCDLPPGSWTCSFDSYDSIGKGYPNPVCNCNCGAYDPDCAKVKTSDCPAPLVCTSCGCAMMGATCI